METGVQWTWTVVAVAIGIAGTARFGARAGTAIVLLWLISGAMIRLGVKKGV